MIPYTTEYAMGEFSAHGEFQMMSKLPQLQTVFDVGCNIGEWTRMTRRLHPAAHIHMFEMVPFTFDKMLQNGVLDAGIHPNNFGLSNTTGISTFRYAPQNDRVSTTVLDIYHTDSVINHGLITTGDQYCLSRGIEDIDFLKIDTEGHEYSVLEGFEYRISAGLIKMIQFEYGYAAVLTKKLLIDFHKMLDEKYVIGRLTPEGVQFKSYHLLDEDFRGPDYVAVLKTEIDIINRIKA